MALTKLQTLILFKQKWLALVLVLLLGSNPRQVLAQIDVLGTAVQQLYQFKRHTYNEKLFLHVAQESYVCGEVLWFKVYCVEGTNHTLTDVSSVVYVELLAADRTPVMQAKIGMKDGLGNGSFLLPFTLPSGRYLLRAYTNTLKNFSPDFFFEKPVAIINTFTGYEDSLATAASEEPTLDLQFFPEGGYLVNGLESKVAFKLTDAAGKGIQATGEIIDGAGKRVVSFQTQKFGMGSFVFTPTTGTTYTARVKTSSGRLMTQELPQVTSQGYVLRLEEAENQQLLLRVQQNIDAGGNAPTQLYLLGHTRQKISALETAALTPEGEAVFTIDKRKLPEGVTHFTVFDGTQKPIAERLYFAPVTNHLQLQVNSSKPIYGHREPVQLTLAGQGNGNTAAADAQVSLAVFKKEDTGQPTGGDMKTYFYLESEVKGRVEEPTYYFSAAKSADIAQAADLLMLTQGWSRFSWDNIFTQRYALHLFQPEYAGHTIKAKLTNQTTGAPAPEGIAAYLAIPTFNPRFYKAQTQPNGQLNFEVWHFDGPSDLILQTNYLKEKGYMFTVENPFSDAPSSTKVPALQLTNAWKESLAQRHLQVQVENAFVGKQIKRFKQQYLDTIPFYDTPDSRYFLDDFTRFPTMEEVMREYVLGLRVRKRKDGFKFHVYEKGSRRMFRQNPLLVLDGVPVFSVDSIIAYNPLKVKRIDLLEREFKYLGDTYHGLVSYTTYQGKANDIRLDPSALILQYEGMQLQREFYAPRYQTPEQAKSRIADLRHLLHWEPNLTLDAKGRRTVEFFTSDQPGTYQIIVEGLTKDGKPGSAVHTIQVKSSL
ncbi:hypothetical protein [Rufibacter sp. LB8]|uniref:hypothetical protein n=1 Tax=Rufibacter sp. LB8 TaxID=2777781 RepID=UPI00178C4F1B|nr:hypothetical protein [Rufibacter sp. LB8]